MEFTSRSAESSYRLLVSVLDETVVGLDFDGTLAPIVDDPTQARIHPDAPEVLEELAKHVGAIAIITGRPARQVLALGGLDEIGHRIGNAGKELYVFGQYGHERWSSSERRVVTPRPPAALSRLERELPALLRRCDAADAYVEDKGLAVAVHTRRLPDPQGSFDRIHPALETLAGELGLRVEPGKSVVEVRSPGRDKGQVVRELAERLGARGFLFVGDDLGDVEAFEAVAELRAQGLATICAYSESHEQPVLRESADLVLPGPDGVMAMLRDLSWAAHVL